MPPILRPLTEGRYPTTSERIQELIGHARYARRGAYARYSGFLVGAAILTDDAQIFTGVNVEGVDYDVTHAEESAISAMRLGTMEPPVLIVAVGAVLDAANPLDAPVIPPCGKCRQKIYEWVRKTQNDIDVVIADPETGLIRLCSIRELLPLSF